MVGACIQYMIMSSAILSCDAVCAGSPVIIMFQKSKQTSTRKNSFYFLGHNVGCNLYLDKNKKHISCQFAYCGVVFSYMCLGHRNGW